MTLPTIKPGPLDYFDFSGPHPERGTLSPDLSRSVGRSYALPAEPAVEVEMGIVDDAPHGGRQAGQSARDLTARTSPADWGWEPHTGALERHEADYEDLLRKIGKGSARTNPNRTGDPTDLARRPAAPPPPPLPLSMKADQLARDAARRPRPDTDADYRALLERLEVKPKRMAGEGPGYMYSEIRWR